MQRVTILGSTGSIGVSTLDVIARHKDQYRVFALTADRRWQLLATQCLEHRPEYAVINCEASARLLMQELKKQSCNTQVLVGCNALEQVAASEDTDIVMAAIVGAVGLMPALAAARAGKKVLLANKEALVMAGAVFTQAIMASGAILLPIDSEHNAIFQCLPNQANNFLKEGVHKSGVRKILLTASGGPFLHTPLNQLGQVTPAQACAHPNWKMGQKISVDSATMLNKGLELIEACWLFNVNASDIEVVIHPQSVIHSMVEYIDGSVLAQLGNPDMRTPIAHALAWPERMESGVSRLDLIATARLDFVAPDLARFPCLHLSQQVATRRGTAPAMLNAANEVAVAAFLSNRLPFMRIHQVIDETLQRLSVSDDDTLEAVQQADADARRVAQQYIDSL